MESHVAHDLEARAKRVGLSVNELCRRAEVARSTFTRWKSGETEPQMRLLRRLEAVLDEAERDAVPVSADAAE